MQLNDTAITSANTKMNIEKEEYQVVVTGITWSKNIIGKYRNSKKTFNDKLPTQLEFIIPSVVINKISQSAYFNDELETYIYNFLTTRYNHLVYHCQIWLPFEGKTKAIA